MINKGTRRDKKMSSTDANFYNEERIISQVQIEQKLIHFQTVLMLTQLNSAYYQFHLTLNKVLSKLQKKYLCIKMKAFLKLINFKRHFYQAHFLTTLQNSHTQINRVEIKKEREHVNDRNISSKATHKIQIIIQQNIQYSKSKVYITIRLSLNKIAHILSNKKTNLTCFSFYRLAKYSFQQTLRIFAEKKQKQEEIESGKSDIKNHSLKRENKKYYSIQKPKDSYNNQPSYQIKSSFPTSLLSNNSRSIVKTQNEENNLGQQSKLFQRSYGSVFKDRRNRFGPSGERKIIKATSSKMIRASVSNERQQQIIELQYLKRKYNKLVGQFNKFSQRFLKAIEQQQQQK